MPTELDYSDIVNYARALADEGEGIADALTRRRQADVLSVLPGRQQGKARTLEAAGDTVRKFIGEVGRARTQSTTSVMQGDPAVDVAPILNTAQLAFTGGMPMAARGAAGIFGGRLAANADRGALREAEMLLQTGADPRKVYRQTGWFRDPADGEMKFEISDALSTYKLPSTWDAIKLGAKSEDALRPGASARDLLPPMSQYFKHAELEKAYPGMLDDLRFGLLPRGTKGMTGGFDPTNRALYLSPRIDKREGRSVGLHELEHDVQRREGFPVGGTTNTAELQPIAREAAPRLQGRASDFLDEVERKRLDFMQRAEANDPVLSDPHIGAIERALRRYELERAFWRSDPQMAREHQTARALAKDPDTAFQEAQFLAYKRISGETAARNVQTRADMSKKTRREIPPWETADYPPEGQIVLRPPQRVLPF